MARGNGSATPVNDDIAVERELPCKLNDDELRMRGDAMAEAELEVDRLKDERRALNKKIFASTDVRNKLAHVIDSESEPRMVVCKWIASFEENVYRLIRQDTGELVEQRPMSAADRQAALPYPPDGGDGDAAGEGSGIDDIDDADDVDDERPADDDDDDAPAEDDDEDGLPSHPDDDPPDADPEGTKPGRKRARVRSPRKRARRPAPPRKKARAR